MRIIHVVEHLKNKVPFCIGNFRKTAIKDFSDLRLIRAIYKNRLSTCVMSARMIQAKVKAGEQISLVDLAEAIKADKERGKEKPSIRAQLKADKERTGKKKNAKQKSQDLERS